MNHSLFNICKLPLFKVGAGYARGWGRHESKTGNLMTVGAFQIKNMCEIRTGYQTNAMKTLHMKTGDLIPPYRKGGISNLAQRNLADESKRFDTAVTKGRNIEPCT